MIIHRLKGIIYDSTFITTSPLNHNEWSNNGSVLYILFVYHFIVFMKVLISYPNADISTMKLFNVIICEEALLLKLCYTNGGDGSHFSFSLLSLLHC